MFQEKVKQSSGLITNLRQVSPFTYVIWAPLHDLDVNSGVYYVNQKESLEIMKEEQDSGLVNGPTVLNMIENKKPETLNLGRQ